MGWQDAKAVPTVPASASPSGSGWQSAAPVNVNPPSPAMAQALTDSAPGIQNAKNPMEAFMAGLHMSASGLVKSGGKLPDITVPANASFAQKVANGFGQAAGDLPFNLIGAVGGAAAGAESGPGAIASGGAGGMALPQAVRETMMDYYKIKQGGGQMSWADVASMIAHSAWNTSKAAVEGFVGGKVAGVAGDIATNVAAPAFARTAANIGGFTVGSTASQAALERHIPDAKDFVASAIVALPLGVAAHVMENGQTKMTQAGETVTENMKQGYRDHGTPPWQQADMARKNPAMSDEIISQDVNGKPVQPNFKAQAPQEPEPYKTNFKTTAQKLQDEHEQEVSELTTDAHVKQHVEELLPQVKTLEGSGDHAISPKGAVGRYQILPGTAREYGFDPDRLMDPAYNEKVARTVLADLSRKFHGDTEAVLVAYNAGPGRAFRFVRDGRDTSELPQETQRYLAHAGFGGKGGKPPEPPPPAEEPEVLVPAIKDTEGNIHRGQPGQFHSDVEIPEGKKFADSGWATPDGEFLSNEEAAKRVGSEATTGRNYLESRDYNTLRTGSPFIGGGGKGGKPPIPPSGSAGQTGGEGRPAYDFSKLTIESLRSRFQDAIGEEPEARTSWIGDPMRQFVSELESARGIDKTMQKLGLLDPTKDITTEEMFRQTYASDDRANYMFTKGNIDPVTFDAKEGGSLVDVLQQMRDKGGNIGDFNMYRVAQRTLDLAKRGVDTGVFKGGVAEAGNIVQRPELQIYKGINEAMQNWKRGGLEYGRDSGLWTHERMLAMEDASSHVAFRRIMGDDKAFSMGSSGPSKFRASNPLKEMEGSDRQIVEPLTADMDNLRQIIRMSDRNKAIGHVIMSMEQAKLSRPSTFEEIYGGLGLKRLSNAEVKKMMPPTVESEPGKGDFAPYNLTAEQEEAFRPFAMERYFGGAKNNRYFIYYREGVPEVWQAADENVAKLFRGADSAGEADLLTKILQVPAKLERAGILAAPDFALRVPLKHQLTAWALDPLHPAPYLTAIRGFADVMGKSDAYYDLMRRGGLSGAITDLDLAKAVDRAVGDQDVLTQTGALDKAWNTVKHPLQMAQMVTEKLTEMERTGYFKTAVAKGINPNKAAMMGRKAYLDFSEKATGNLANWLAKTIPFFRATMLGLRQGRDAVVDRPGQTMLYGSALLAAQAGFYILNRQADRFLDDKDKYTSLPQWEREQMFITPPLAGTRIKLARPYVIGPMLGVPMERMLEMSYEKDPHAWDDWFSATFTDLAPSNMPAALRPIYEQTTNHNFFTGHPLVSDSLKNMTADEQYQENTSQLAKDISAKLGAHRGLDIAEVSPIVLDNYVQEWGGSVGSFILHRLDAPLGKRPIESDWRDMPFVRGFVVQNPRMNTQQVTDFYRDAEQWNAVHADVAREVKQGDLEQAQADKTGVGGKTIMITKIEHALNVQHTALAAIQKRDDLNTDEKRQLSNRIYNDAWQIARFGTRVLHGDQVSQDEANSLSDQATGDIQEAMSK